MDKDKGGLGILNLRCMNISLLTKWLWKLEKEEGLWQTIVNKKYMKGKPLCILRNKQGDSQFWRGLLYCKDKYCDNRKMEIGNGLSTSFWSDIWCGDVPLPIKYKRLFELSLNKEINVNWALSVNWNSLTFRRRLVGEGAKQLEDLINDCGRYWLADREDKPSWLLDKKGYSVKSMYNHFKQDGGRTPFWFIWKAKIPQRIKVFLWLILNDKILSKENLSKRNWQGNARCDWCGCLETTSHIFYDCQVASFTWKVIQMVLDSISLPNNSNDMFGKWLCGFKVYERNLITIGCSAVLWSLWKTRNDCCFNSINLYNAADILFLCCSWLDDWAILQKETPKKILLERSSRLRKMAKEFFNRRFGWAPVDNRLCN
jgi:hypothetical protein